MRRRVPGHVALALLTAGLYAIAAKVSLSWFDSNGLGPAFFPAAGITLSALVLSGYAGWPWVLAAVAVTEFWIDVATGVHGRAAVGYALANTAEPFVGALLLRRAAGRPDLGRRRDLWAFLLLACAAGPAVGAAVAATTTALDGGQRPWPLFAARWLLGDGLGVLLVGGAAIGWRSGDAAARARLYRPSGLALLGTAVVASLAVFRWDLVWLGYVLAALLVAVAFRLGTRGVGITGALMAAVVGEAAATGRIDVPSGVSSDAAWFALNLVVGLVVVVGFALAVEIGEREESVRRRQEAEEARREAEVTAAAAVERSRLLDAEQRARARAELLQDITNRLSGLTAPERIVAAITELTAGALHSRTAILALHDAHGRLRAAASHGYGPDEREVLDAVLAAGARVPLVAAFSSGGFVSASGREAVDRVFPDAIHLPAQFDAAAAVACVVDGRPIGALGWGFTDGRTFDEDFEALALAIGAQSALAVERGRLFETERRTAARLGALQSAVAALAAASGTEAVVAAVVDSGASAVGASGVAVRVTGPGGALVTLGASGPDAAGLAGPAGEALLRRALEGGQVVTLPGPDGEGADGPAVAAVPFSSGGIRGALLLGFDTVQEFDEERVALLGTFGQAAGQSLARAASAEREHGVAVELQRSLLGTPDPVAGLEVATLYRPGTVDLQVGGDWYDVIGLPRGAAALVIGDVTGHSLGAAAAMGQIRSTLRALAPIIDDPAALLERLDGYVEQIDGAALTSLFYAVLTPADGTLRYSCAGHPPPLLVPRRGEPEFLDDGHGPLLGLGPAVGPRSSTTVTLDPSDTLVLYTDGLVEHRGESLTKGLADLESACRATVPSAATAAAVCERLSRTLLSADAADDTALLVVRRAR